MITQMTKPYDNAYMPSISQEKLQVESCIPLVIPDGTIFSTCGAAPYLHEHRSKHISLHGCHQMYLFILIQ